MDFFKLLINNEIVISDGCEVEVVTLKTGGRQGLTQHMVTPPPAFLPHLLPGCNGDYRLMQILRPVSGSCKRDREQDNLM